ncbi:MAG: ABC transporter ATP-binding protein [Bdellovibrionota bacterium]
MIARSVAFIKKILELFTTDERRTIYRLLMLVVLMAGLETLGVASIMPFIAVLANPEKVESSPYLHAFYTNAGFTNRQNFEFFLGLLVLFIFVGSVVVRGFTTWRLNRFVHLSTYTISRRLVYGYLHKPYEWFLHRHSSDLGKTILTEVEQVVGEALMPFLNLIAYGAVVFAIIALLMVVNPELTIYAGLSLGLAYGAIYVLFHKRLSQLGSERFAANKLRFQILSEAFGGIKELKVRRLEDVFVDRYSTPSKCYAVNKANAQAAMLLPRFALEVLIFGGMLVLLLYLMRTSNGIQEALPIITLYAFAGYRLAPALQQVYSQIANLRFAEPVLAHMHREVTSVTSEPSSKTVAEKIRFEKSIVLSNVTFKYPQSERAALKDINLEISKRKTIGLVGETGSGKTTLVDIILGLLRPTQGSLKIDDQIITEGNSVGWQKNIGYVSQSIYLADDSIAANIAFGIPENQIDLKAVERAARIANLHDYVVNELPDGYRTKVGERGVRLSGGQRQRIAIARALYHGPQVLILDEATSALDNLTEQYVMDAIRNLKHAVTVVVIAHRLTTVRDCDEIFLLSHGSIVASGTYDDLLDDSPVFRSMASNQLA